jgi:hypothetical protein
MVFATDQEKAAGELLRVCQLGGKIGLVSRPPDSFIGGLFRIIGNMFPHPPGDGDE